MELTPGGIAPDARRRGHQLADHRRVRVLFGRLHRAAQGSTTRWSSRRRSPTAISFGCGDRSDATFFGEAFFQRGLAKADSFEAAFDTAKKRVDEREKAEGYSPPSNPQIWIGEAMTSKLKALRSRGASSGVSAGVSAAAQRS